MTTIHEPSTKQDILQHLVKQGQTSAQLLAEHLGISPQAVRRHLKDLEDEGLIEREAVQSGMGRPNYLYSLSQQGRDRLPERYNDFAVSLLNTLAQTVGPDQMGTILRKQWEQKALDYRNQVGGGSLAERVARLAELRQLEGYMAEWHVVDNSTADDSTADAADSTADSSPQYIITEYNCAISQIAESFPSVCGHELNMFEIALQGCRVQRTHWQANGEHRCGYLIQSK